MINGDDPPPLDAPASQSPEALVRALRALGREQPSDAALRATGQRLQARLNAPPVVAPAPVQTAAVQVARTNTLLAGRLIMAALTAAVGVGSFVLVQRSKPASERPNATTADLPSAPVSNVPPVALPAQHTLPTANEGSATTRAASTANGSSASGGDLSMRRAPPKIVEHRRTRERATDKSSASSVTPTQVPAQAAVLSTAKPSVPPTPVAEVAETTREPSTVERTAERQPAAIPAGELALLLDARKQSHRDPNEVLRLTAEHARRFPDGALAPEREVLAIQALRALGRGAQADARLRRFRASYPDSLHTRALTTGTTR